ncbi:hypothetical protein B9T33_09100 [Acinetobacter sp. ANC 5054]|uniref:SseB family protein n=1 Tax=Acinetobacter sp. ANC 5054 TaxID=1977877 RepID=UPI000A34459A|nr:SseB family protein [Acinetobacter sp. ANC 5054]OTG80572.1 hypothetical protein B9T33_09100 [Acinetobacter sp. ANC 5054]
MNESLQELYTSTLNHPEQYAAFYQQLLRSEVFCLGARDEQQHLHFQLLQTEQGEQAIPFFLSLAMLQQDVGADAEFVMINAEKLFSITKGATLVMNPTSDNSKEFLPDEVDAILNFSKNESL